MLFQNGHTLCLVEKFSQNFQFDFIFVAPYKGANDDNSQVARPLIFILTLFALIYSTYFPPKTILFAELFFFFLAVRQAYDLADTRPAAEAAGGECSSC